MRYKSARALQNMLRNAIRSTVTGCVTAFAFSSALSAELSVRIVDAHSQAIPDAVVIATPLGSATPRAPAPTTAVMDQIGKAFVPIVLVVQTGTPVIFPNSDTVAHQVYSFSPARRFELPLYRGQVHPPITFDHPGLVILGCNIHDNMVGYIYVTDSPYSGLSDARGQWAIADLPVGDYEVSVWSHRMPRDSASVSQHISVNSSTPAEVQFRLKDTLRPAVGTPQGTRLRDY